MKLYQIAKLVRSKNAGPFMLTVDILFETDTNYQKVLRSKVLSAELIGEIFGIPPEKVDYYECPKARALKFSFPRKYNVGDFRDSDIFGGQYHARLVDVEIPI
jgi:hypothetical protein